MKYCFGHIYDNKGMSHDGSLSEKCFLCPNAKNTYLMCEIIYDKTRMKQKSLSDHSQNDENHADEK